MENEIIIDEGEAEVIATKTENKDEIFEEVRSLLNENELKVQEQIDSVDIQEILNVIRSINQPIKLYDTTQSIIKNLQRFSNSDAGGIYLIRNNFV